MEQPKLILKMIHVVSIQQINGLHRHLEGEAVKINF
jgi:hypothetical protein